MAPLDPSHLGHSYRSSTPYEVGREKIREFAAAIGDRNPACQDPAAARAVGHPDVIAPPTFPIVFTFAASGPLLEELGIELRHVVHGDQRFAYVRPIRAGDRVICVVTVDNIRAMAGSTLLTTRVDAVTVEEEPVLTAWSTLVVRKPSEAAAEPASDSPAVSEGAR